MWARECEKSLIEAMNSAFCHILKPSIPVDSLSGYKVHISLSYTHASPTVHSLLLPHHSTPHSSQGRKFSLYLWAVARVTNEHMWPMRACSQLYLPQQCNRLAGKKTTSTVIIHIKQYFAMGACFHKPNYANTFTRESRK